MSRAMCRTSGAAFCLAKGTFPAQGFSFPQPPDDTKRPLRRRKRGMLKEATILDKIDGKFIPHLSSKMVRFSFRVVCYTAVFSVVTQRSSPSVTTLKTAVWQTSFRAASSFNFFLGGGRGGGLLFQFLLSVVQDWTFRAEEHAKRPQRRRARRNGCFRRLGAKVCYDLWNTGFPRPVV